MIDAEATPAQRVQRGVAGQLADWDERRKFEVSSRTDQIPRSGDARTGRQRVDELIELRQAQGVDAIKVPSSVDLCASYAAADPMGGNALYRLASGFAHGKQWTLLLGDSTSPDGVDPDVPGPRRVEANDTVSVWVTRAAVDTYALAISDLERYVGVST